MTELEALRRVAEAAREIASQLLLSEMTIEDRCDADVEGGYDALIERMRPLVRALDALPAPAAEPVAEVVVCYVSRSDGSATWVLPGSMAGVMIARSENWRRVGEMRVPLPRVPEVVGEVG